MGVVAVTLIAGLSPRFRRRPLIFAYPLREGVVALGGLLLVAAILWTGFPGFPTPAYAAPVVSGDRPLRYSRDDFLRQVTVAVLAAAPFILAMIVRRQPPLSAGWGKATRSPSLLLGLALGLITLFLRGKVYAILNGVSPGEIYYLVAALAVSLATEFIFRGFVQLRLAGWLGEIPGWLATSALYALFQLPQTILVYDANPAQWGVQIARALVAGLVYGWVMRKSGHILAPAIYSAFHTWALVL